MSAKSYAQTKLPVYKSHKTVQAFKVQEIIFCTDGQTQLIPTDYSVSPIHVSGTYTVKHQPAVGGYYVVYEDGYESFSPAKAFEDGYSLIIEKATSKLIREAPKVLLAFQRNDGTRETLTTDSITLSRELLLRVIAKLQYDWEIIDAQDGNVSRSVAISNEEEITELRKLITK